MPIRIDFGRLFPGLVILLIGVALFVLWLLLVFVSFFAFFVPELRGIFYLDLDILVASIVLMLSGGLLMLLGFSGWRQMDQRGWWTGGHVTRRVDRDRMKAGERGGEVFGVFISFLFLLFFIENQLRDTGFFTSRFGPVEEALFYGTWLVGAAVSLARAAYGRRNAIRPFDALDGALLAITAFWLLSVFPFDFSHLPDLLPSQVRFALSWVSNPVGEVLMALAGIGGLVSMFYNAVMYAVVRSRQRFGGTPHSW
jgi:hypothetical protein